MPVEASDVSFLLAAGIAALCVIGGMAAMYFAGYNAGYRDGQMNPPGAQQTQGGFVPPAQRKGPRS